MSYLSSFAKRSTAIGRDGGLYGFMKFYILHYITVPRDIWDIFGTYSGHPRDIWILLLRGDVAVAAFFDAFLAASHRRGNIFPVQSHFKAQLERLTCNHIWNSGYV